MRLKLFAARDKRVEIHRGPDYPGYPDWVAYEPSLIPPEKLMRSEGITVLEEWFRWAEEWSMLLRIYGNLHASSRVLEIGCGLGRIAFALRYLIPKGSYSGFEIVREKTEFLQKNFQAAHPNFKFRWANIHNTYYNPEGKQKASRYQFESKNNSFDTVFAASVFTHLHPEAALNYFKETARVLAPGGKAVFSFFILDYLQPAEQRPYGFSRPAFNFGYKLPLYGDSFAYSNPDNQEEMTAFSMTLLKQFASESNLEICGEPIPGLWSGRFKNGIGSQDLLILRKPG